MTTVNHWGRWVNSEQPIVGVVKVNSLEFIHEEADAGINATEKAAYNQALTDFTNSLAHDEELDESKLAQFSEMFWGSYESCGDEYLIGGWILDESDDKYDIDREAEYSAIVNYDANIVQVIHSKWVTRCELCSPCYPGQGDLDTPGEFLAYDLPQELYGSMRENENPIEEWVR